MAQFKVCNISTLPPPPQGIGGLIRLINIYISSMERIMPEHNACAALTATLINFIGVNFMKIVVIIILYSGFSCTRDFLKRLQKEIEFIAPAVPTGVLLTTEQLCGIEYWGRLSKWERTLAGICMMYLVDNGSVPFEYVPRHGRNPYPLQFRIKASYTPNR